MTTATTTLTLTGTNTGNLSSSSPARHPAPRDSQPNFRFVGWRPSDLRQVVDELTNALQMGLLLAGKLATAPRADLLDALDARVIFWPGTSEGPRDHGRRHFERYRQELPVTLRSATSRLFLANAGLEPAFCAYNSGSPRFSGGRPSPRGPDTFVTASRFPRPAADVVELSFDEGVSLPQGWEYDFARPGLGVQFRSKPQFRYRSRPDDV